MSILMVKPTYTVKIGASIITPSFLDCDVKVYMNTSFEPDQFSIKLYNIDAITQQFIRSGAIVTVNLGYESGFINNVLTGVVTNVLSDDTQGETVKTIEGIDKVIFDLRHTTINLSLNTPTDVVEIIRIISSMSSVLLSPSSLPSGVILDNYSVDAESAYTEIKRLAKRINYNVTAKNSMLFVTPTLTDNVLSVVVTDSIDMKFTDVKAITNDGKFYAKGFNFFGAGIPTFIPMRLITLNLIEDGIYGTYVIESVTHSFDSKGGYLVSGTIVEPSVVKDASSAIQYPSPKSISSRISEKIGEIMASKKTLVTGIVDQSYTGERLVSAKIGLNNAKNKGSVIQSIEGAIGEENVILIKKPVSSLFAGDGFGLITPLYEGTRSVIGFNRFDSQDADILGFLFKKGWVIPEHDPGDWMLHHKEHSKEVHKEDGSMIRQCKSLRIQIGSSGLTLSKPSPTDDGKFLIEFDDGSELSYKAGDGWKLSTTGNVEVDGAQIKVGSGASLGGARLNDEIIINAVTDVTWITWLTSLYTALTTFGPIVPSDGGASYVTPHVVALSAIGAPPSSQKGKINEASSKVKIE